MVLVVAEKRGPLLVVTRKTLLVVNAVLVVTKKRPCGFRRGKRVTVLRVWYGDEPHYRAGGHGGGIAVFRWCGVPWFIVRLMWQDFYRGLHQLCAPPLRRTHRFSLSVWRWHNLT